MHSSSKRSLSLGISHQTPVWRFHHPHTCHVTRPFRYLFDHPSNPRWGIPIMNASDPNVFLTTLIHVAVWAKLLWACSRFMCCGLMIPFRMTLYQNLTCLVCFLVRQLLVFGRGLISTVCTSSYLNLVIAPNVISATLHFRPSSSCLQILQGRWVPPLFPATVNTCYARVLWVWLSQFPVLYAMLGDLLWQWNCLTWNK